MGAEPHPTGGSLARMKLINRFTCNKLDNPCLTSVSSPTRSVNTAGTYRFHLAGGGGGGERLNPPPPPPPQMKFVSVLISNMH